MSLKTEMIHLHDIFRHKGYLRVLVKFFLSFFVMCNFQSLIFVCCCVVLSFISYISIYI